MSAIESFIDGSEKLTRIFGCWPSFHDAEVVELRIWRGNVDPNTERYVFPVLVVWLQMWELTPETDVRGFLVSKRHALVTLCFHGLDETLKLDGFNHQNALFEMRISRHERTDGSSPYFDVRFVSSFGMDASFGCLRVEVIDVAPFALRDTGNAKQVSPHDPPPRSSVSDGSDTRTLDSLPAPDFGGGR